MALKVAELPDEEYKLKYELLPQVNEQSEVGKLLTVKVDPEEQTVWPPEITGVTNAGVETVSVLPLSEFTLELFTAIT